MSNFFRYNIAGFPVLFETGLDKSPLDKIDGFKLFATKDHETPVLKYSTCGVLSQMSEYKIFTEDNAPLIAFDFDDEDIKCFFYRDTENLLFKMIPRNGEIHLFAARYSEGCLNVVSNWEENKHGSMLRFSMWMAFSTAIAPLCGIPIHSSVNVYNGKAVLFLGESGTGKSTHTRLWRENIPGTFLLNDDSPIIKVSTGSDGAASVVVCGSPWSGKTPCYKKEEYPVAAIVRLSQAPANTISKLSKLSSFGAIYPSCPPSFAHDEHLSDNICNTISSIIKTVPVYHLNCLPDAQAAFLSFNTVYNQQIEQI